MMKFPIELIKIIFASVLLGCNTGKVVVEQGSTDYDARFISQVKTWDCLEGGTDPILGTYGHEVSLFYAPSSLNDLIPTDGCAAGVDPFPITAGSNGSSFDGLVGFPGWRNDDQTGTMEGGFGYWYQDVLTDEHTCESPSQILDSNIGLINAQDFSGATMPVAFSSPEVEFNGFDSVIDFGDEVDVSWTTHNWPRTWIHLRRTNDGQVVEMVTCAISDSTLFSLDGNVWDLMSEELNADTNQLYVGFENREIQETQSGRWIEVLNRSVAVAVVNN